MPDGRLVERGEFAFRQLEPPPERTPDPRPNDLQARAEALLATAHADAHCIREEARQQGFAQGFETGRSAAEAELEPAAAALAAALDAARRLTAEAADATERQAVELGLHVAEQVVAGTIAVAPDRLLDAVSGALRALVERQRVLMLVNPADLELVRSSIGSLSASLGGIEHVEVQGERRVERGGAILRTTVGEIDARVETKLARARAVLEAELAR
ncbi:MAG: hypothetical protein NVSMB25_16960 [Thermoleophilaceae bacterium]